MESAKNLKGINIRDQAKLYQFIDERIAEIHKVLEHTVSQYDTAIAQGRIEELRFFERQLKFYSKVYEG